MIPGLSIPVPRGRKGKRVKAQSTFDVQKVEWIRKYNPDTLLLDDSYRKHLKHQCNKSENHLDHMFLITCSDIKSFFLSRSDCRVLLRVRMLYYLKQEVIGEHAESILKGADIRYLILFSLIQMKTQPNQANEYLETLDLYCHAIYSGMSISGCLTWNSKRCLQYGGTVKQTAHFSLVFSNMVF